MLVLVLQEVIVCNLSKILFLNRLFHGGTKNFFNGPRIFAHDSDKIQVTFFAAWL